MGLIICIGKGFSRPKRSWSCAKMCFCTQLRVVRGFVYNIGPTSMEMVFGMDLGLTDGPYFHAGATWRALFEATTSSSSALSPMDVRFGSGAQENEGGASEGTKTVGSRSARISDGPLIGPRDCDSSWILESQLW